MTIVEQIITIAVVALGTMLTRFLPFVIFRPGNRTPQCVKYLGTVLPSAVLALLVVYCLKDVNVLAGSRGIPELIAIAAVVTIHLWKRQMLISIATGTLIYMALIQYVFY